MLETLVCRSPQQLNERPFLEIDIRGPLWKMGGDFVKYQRDFNVMQPFLVLPAGQFFKQLQRESVGLSAGA
jgi:hypothetical protein